MYYVDSIAFEQLEAHRMLLLLTKEVTFLDNACLPWEGDDVSTSSILG